MVVNEAMPTRSSYCGCHLGWWNGRHGHTARAPAASYSFSVATTPASTKAARSALQLPPLLNADFARHFASAKPAMLLTDATGTIGMLQTGAARVEGFSAAGRWPVVDCSTEAMIETFVLPEAEKWSANGLESTGGESSFADAWFDLAKAMASVVLGAAKDHDIALVGTGYLTVSVTPQSMVQGLPHFDDDMLDPFEGVGLVAICGSIAGPRVATDVLAWRLASRPTQLSLDDMTIAAFERGDLPCQQGAPDEVVIFPQFAQLHAGPPLAACSAASQDHQRHLMVLRCATRLG